LSEVKIGWKERNFISQIMGFLFSVAELRKNRVEEDGWMTGSSSL
jgi:hypothetical protein